MFMKLDKFGNILQKKVNQFVETVCLYCRSWFHNNIKNKKIEPVTTELINGNALKNSTLSKPQDMYSPSGRFAFVMPRNTLPRQWPLFSLQKRFC